MRHTARWSVLVGLLAVISCLCVSPPPAQAGSSSKSVQVRIILPERPSPQLPGAFNAAVAAGHLTLPPPGTERTTTLLRDGRSTTLLHTQTPTL
jgi:hypothetical protein